MLSPVSQRPTTTHTAHLLSSETMPVEKHPAQESRVNECHRPACACAAAPSRPVPDRLDNPAHDPGVFADLADAGEAVLLEKLDRRAEQEAALRLTVGGHLRDRLDKPAAHVCDLIERAFQRRPRDALTAVLLVHEEAGDPPVWRRRSGLVILAPVLDARKFFGTTVLAPALRGAILVEDERGMRAAFLDPAFLCGTIVRRACPGRLGVVAHAPAAAEDPVVALDEFGERGPCGCVEPPDRIPHRSRR